MLEDGSGKIRIVEGEMVRLDEGEDIGPVLFNVVTGGLADGMKLEGDHCDDSRGGDGLQIGFRELESLENPVIDQHEVERRERKSGRRFKLMEIRGLGEGPVMQFEKLGLPSAGGRSGDQQIQIKSRARMAESSHRMSTDHEGREVLLFDQLGNGGEETLHGWNLARSARESQRSMGS